ncbi:MAG: uroporphyrinogen-III synthase [Balneolaceae bacterium]
MKRTHNILITREITDDQLALAQNLGLNVLVEPAIEIEFRDNWLSVQSTLKEIETPVFVFTSQNGVEAFDRFRKAGVEFPEKMKVYAVGEKSAKRLKEIGIDAIIPEKQTGVGLAKKIISDVEDSDEIKNPTVLHFCGDRRRDELRQLLTDAEFKVKDVVVYKTILNQMEFRDANYDAVLFFSPSAVQAYREGGGFRRGKHPELFAIGTTTAEELSIESGRHVHISPKPGTETLLKFTAQILNDGG